MLIKCKIQHSQQVVLSFLTPYHTSVSIQHIFLLACTSSSTTTERQYWQRLL